MSAQCGVRAAAMHTALMAFTSDEADDFGNLETKIEAQSSTTRGRKRNLFRAIISLRRCSLLELQAGD